MRENIGDIPCPYCKTEAHVRLSEKKRYYVSCPSCGLIQAWGDGAQVKITEQANIYGATAPNAKEEPANKPAPAGKSKGTEKPRGPAQPELEKPAGDAPPVKRGFLSDIDL